MLRLVFAAILFASFSLSACNAPVSPAFEINSERVTFIYSETAAGRVHVAADFRMKNIGNADLSQLTVNLPNGQASGRLNLHVTFDKTELEIPGSDDTRRSEFRIPLKTPWVFGRKAELHIEYDLATDSDIPGDLQFPGGWLPTLVKPRGLLARGASWADNTRVFVRGPRGFRILAGPQAQVGESHIQFRLRAGDFDPPVIIGPYLEQKVHTPTGTVVFWTLKPLPLDRAQRAGAILAAVSHSYESLFGPQTKKETPAYFIEASQWLESAPPAAAFYAVPRMIILNSSAFALEVDSDSFLRLAEAWLARTWMGGLVSASSFREIGLQEAIIEHAQYVAHGERSRKDIINGLLDEYERVARLFPENPISANWSIGEVEAQHNLLRNKSQLFLLALEDKVGKEALRHGIRHLVQALRGEKWDIDDLRSALELESGQNLAEFFRVWLYQPGIPDDFRRRYSSP
ncbi:MAG TPA: hypothetical protein VIH68_06440 [Bacteroidota bacterium]